MLFLENPFSVRPNPGQSSVPGRSPSGEECRPYGLPLLRPNPKQRLLLFILYVSSSIIVNGNTFLSVYIISLSKNFLLSFQLCFFLILTLFSFSHTSLNFCQHLFFRFCIFWRTPFHIILHFLF